MAHGFKVAPSKPSFDGMEESNVQECKRRNQSGKQKNKTTQTGYATELLSHSLVTGVSNIVTAKSKFQKVFKIAVLISCACGFFYQATQFMMFFLTYPHVVDIEVFTPKEMIGPAYTFCNNNGVKRSKFCSKYPDSCYIPENKSVFCRDHHGFCKEFDEFKNVSVPMQQNYSFETTVTFDELKELGHTLQDVLSHTLIDHDEISGPFIVTKGSAEDHILCYSAYLRIDNDKDPEMIRTPNKLQKDIAMFKFDVEPHEVFRPDRQPGIMFAVHSPFEFENPTEVGFFMRPGRGYNVHIRMEEEQLLPYPYRSDCFNYTKNWEELGRKGPRSQLMSIKKCLLDFFVKYCHCNLYELNYPTEGPYCHVKDILSDCLIPKIAENETIVESLEKCEDAYRDECQKQKYIYQFSQRFAETSPYEPNASRTTDVKVISKDQEVIKYRYKPQYQEIEIFSYVGGFMGAWIGVSLVAIIDLLESFCLIAISFFKRRSSTKPNQDENPEDQQEKF